MAKKNEPTPTPTPEELVARAVQALVSMAEDPSIDPQYRIRAAVMLLDERGDD